MIRLATLEPHHRPRVREILDATAAFEDIEVDVALELFDEAFSSATTPIAAPASYEFVGAFGDDGSLAGYACYGSTPSAEGVYDLYWIAMHPDRQGTGAGSRLLAEVEQRLQARQARLLVAETSSRDAYAGTRHFYERRGYRAEARIAGFYGAADDRIVYVKRFTQFPTLPGVAG